ncbi:protein OPI10 homolog isoform X2 [Portunus trituberculatus]|uniref:Protein OPI10 n=1 Tax=Portunus trituberculatus TaxID=210409 RepID=A0A5B7F363_PORTR|nr:protein OPI10 homolog isoform X2 [Portunus trituberculatus]MPC40075.1 Protein OPI10 [Portunus trituberculatus]
MANLFGIIVSGRLVQTNFQQCGETQFLTVIPEADNINHVVVFLTGTQPFPDGLGGSVYFSWPDPNKPPTWHLLGNITNEKPSAIFKISGLKQVNGTSLQTGFTFGEQKMSHNAQIGISVEPLSQIQGQVANPSTEPSTLNSYVEFSQAMCENLYNYASSFAQSPSHITPNPSDQYLPLSVLSKWYENFSRRLQQNPNFWRK